MNLSISLYNQGFSFKNEDIYSFLYLKYIFLYEQIISFYKNYWTASFLSLVLLIDLIIFINKYFKYFKWIYTIFKIMFEIVLYIIISIFHKIYLLLIFKYWILSFIFDFILRLTGAKTSESTTQSVIAPEALNIKNKVNVKHNFINNLTTCLNDIIRKTKSIFCFKTIIHEKNILVEPEIKEVKSSFKGAIATYSHQMFISNIYATRIVYLMNQFKNFIQPTELFKKIQSTNQNEFNRLTNSEIIFSKLFFVLIKTKSAFYYSINITFSCFFKVKSATKTFFLTNIFVSFFSKTACFIFTKTILFRSKFQKIKTNKKICEVQKTSLLNYFFNYL